MEIVSTCPVCGQTYFVPHLTAKDHTITNEEFQLVKCSACHLILTSPQPSEKNIGGYYISENYISHSGKSETLFDKIYLLARRYTLGWKYELIKKYIQQDSTLLDYGCGTGEFLQFIKGKNLNGVGVEPSKIARDKANQKLEGKVQESLQDIKENSVKIITLWHVLEHVHNLNETINHLKSLLTEDGYILIAVPNPNSHDSKKYKNKWAGYDVPRHLWHFTKESMSLLLKRNGLKIVSIEPMKLDSFYVSLLSEQYKHPNQSKLLTGINAFIEGLISNFSARKNSEYSSLIYIVKKV
jgi:2-polyprenyl-3-methyl-5-hydroxy-6-metoxy-1,4-benzoquinol methylase